jgi:eukaryotic-like serine/threonine-protein kinase
VHGDLSPGNVVFTAEGRPVLTDLGTARLVGDTARAEVTPAYVDPVVARGGAPGPASDVFGVAAAAFHALTGIAPWNAADASGTLSVAAGGELPDLALLAPDAPAELLRVVRRGLSAEPHQRGSAAEFALDLRHACRPEPVRLPVAGVPDAELGRTDRGPHTELTHQVPGRRPRAAHAAPPPRSRRARLPARLAMTRWGERRLPAERGLGAVAAAASRRLAVVAGVLLVVAAGVAGAAWVGASWGGGHGDPVPAADTAQPSGSPAGPAAPVATSAASPSGAVSEATSGNPVGSSGSSGGESSGPPAPSDPDAPSHGPTSVPPVDRTAPPVDDAGWTAVLSDLYTRRAAAFTTVDARVLAGVYAPGAALLDRDTAQVQRLADTGRALSGFSPQVHDLLSVTPTGDGRVVLRLLDELPGYLVVRADAPGATPSQQVAGRGEATVRIVLAPTPLGWRISDASVEP